MRSIIANAESVIQSITSRANDNKSCRHGIVALDFNKADTYPQSKVSIKISFHCKCKLVCLMQPPISTPCVSTRLSNNKPTQASGSRNITPNIKSLR